MVMLVRSMCTIEFLKSKFTFWIGDRLLDTYVRLYINVMMHLRLYLEKYGHNIEYARRCSPDDHNTYLAYG